MDRILVSACLMGRKVRYDGAAKTSEDALLATWRRQGRLVAFCPEVEGGLPVPRPAAEIEGGAGGAAVLDGTARVLTADGADVTAPFLAGARAALEAARSCGARVAILKEGSPSCGSLAVHDGAFGGGRVPGNGVTTALLERNGIAVFGEERVAEAAARLRDLGDAGALEGAGVPDETGVRRCRP
ncbi:DUF523 domain-containing protein [Streptosporangium sp. NPDC023615]|uniref:DUF523 domain-containing protein n=1 Tax=Streptosporangium sp. NPDC023615 TaxID=3154794 RepID=UPI003415D03D